MDAPTIVSRTVQADGTILESEDNGTDEDAFQLVSYAFAMVMTVAILFGGGLLLESVSDEKENRMVEIILTSVSPLGLMAGKVLAQGALALAQVVLWMGSLAIIGPRIFDQLPEVSDLSIEAGPTRMAAALLPGGLLCGSRSYGRTGGNDLLIHPELPAVRSWLIVPGHPSRGGYRSSSSKARTGCWPASLSFFPVTAPTTVVMRMGQTDLSIWWSYLPA